VTASPEPVRPHVPRIRARHLAEPDRVALGLRGVEIARAGVRHLGPLALRQLRHAREGVLSPGEIAGPLRETYEELGGTFIKFGQIIASSPALFGDEVAEEFRACLDTGPRVRFTEIRERIEDDLGMTLREAFASFDTEPIGRASIAVVYRATLHDGRPVAVKVIRPGIDASVAADLELMYPFFELLARQTGDQMAGSALQLLDGFRDQIGEELDLRNEARAMGSFRSLLSEADLPLVAVPEPYPELSGPTVLTMEYFDGVPIDDLAKIQTLGIDPVPLVEQVVRWFFITTVRWGAFHGDMHAGNMMLLRDGRIGVIDWGIVGRLDEETHQFFLRMLAAVLGEEGAWEDVTRHLINTYGPALQEAVGLDQTQLTLFIRSLVEPMLTKPFGQVSLAAVLQTTEAQVARAQGVEARQRSVRAALRRLRYQRRVRRMADEAGGFRTSFDRGNFLLGKQLMYFERYGKLFLSDVPILNDRAFLTSLLDAAASEAGGTAGPASGPGPVKSQVSG
jgi:predicted unusual protein kinase regulating ubiquinone biosynthesis (AarF/ABC1/UbiB family)